MTTTHHTQHDTTHVTIPVRVNRHELLSSVMGSAWSVWSWWRTAEYAEGYNWDTFPDDPTAHYITVGIDDPMDDEERRVQVVRLTTADIVKAVGLALSMHHSIRWDDMDAGDGDVVMQYATLGALVYG